MKARLTSLWLRYRLYRFLPFRVAAFVNNRVFGLIQKPSEDALAWAHQTIERRRLNPNIGFTRDGVAYVKDLSVLLNDPKVKAQREGIRRIFHKEKQREPMSEKTRAPWTPEEVAALNRFQERADFHAFTCPSGCGGTLVAQGDGWHCPNEVPGSPPVQAWAHRFMLHVGQEELPA